MLPLYVVRMQTELLQLQERLDKLTAFCSTVSFSNFDKDSQDLMVEQHTHMLNYALVLNERLQKALRQTSENSNVKETPSD